MDRLASANSPHCCLFSLILEELAFWILFRGRILEAADELTPMGKLLLLVDHAPRCHCICRAIKNFLLDQKNVAGIGNAYVQDILFGARLNPLRDIKKLKPGDVRALHRSIRDVLNRGIRLGGLKYERDLHGRNGRFGSRHFMVGYKAGEPCPVIQTKVRKVRTGSTASYICPKCQRR